MPIYYYAGSHPTLHPVLSLLNPGANEIPDALVPVAEACVRDGLLTHEAEPLPPMPADDEDAMDEEPDA